MDMSAAIMGPLPVPERVGRLLAFSTGVLVVCFGLLAGCQPSYQAAEEARPLPLAERDARELRGAPDHWPAWRGPEASGIAPNGSPPIHFGPDHHVRWRVAVPGSGNSSPVVWGDRILLTTALDGMEPPTLAVLCFDRTNGRLLWQSEVGPARGRTHTKNGYASASVVTDGEHVISYFGATGLFCHNMDGVQLWRADLGPISHVWGLAASPVLHGDMVVQLCDNEDDSYLAAFDKRTGRELWRTSRSSRGCWSTPLVQEVSREGGSHFELIVNGGSVDRCVTAYSPEDGRELWRVEGTTQLVTPTPVESGGLVFCASGRNGPIMAIRPGAADGSDASRVVWKHARGGPYIPTPLAYRNRLFVVTDIGHLTSYNAGNGEALWTERLRGAFTASPVAAAGRLYLVDERGLVRVIATTDHFELLAETDLGETCLATPAIAGGDLIVRTQTSLYCFTADAADDLPPQPVEIVEDDPTTEAKEPATSPDGWPLFRGDARGTGIATTSLPDPLELLWTFADDAGRFETAAVIDRGTVYVGSVGGTFYGVSLAEGRKLWTFHAELGFNAPPAARDGRVYIGDSDGVFYSLDGETGKEIWRFVTDGEINSAPNFHRDRVLFGSQDGNLYCLVAESGELVWKYDSRDQIRCSPTIVDNYTFVAGCDARLHVIDLEEGRLVRSVELDGPTGATPAVAGDLLFVGTESGAFFGIDWRRGQTRWTYVNPQRAGSYRGSAAVAEGLVIIGSRDRMVHALDWKSGQSRWTFSAGSRVDGSPVVVGRSVYVGAANGRLYALDLTSGRERWQFETGGAITASPAVAGGRLVIGTDEGVLYCFGEGK